DVSGRYGDEVAVHLDIVLQCDEPSRGGGTRCGTSRTDRRGAALTAPRSRAAPALIQDRLVALPAIHDARHRVGDARLGHTAELSEAVVQPAQDRRLALVVFGRERAPARPRKRVAPHVLDLTGLDLEGRPVELSLLAGRGLDPLEGACGRCVRR